MTMLTREDILRGLRRIDQMAQDASVVIDLAAYGGTALAMVFDIRVATRDVDAVVRGDPTFLRSAARSVAEDQGWPVDWLNDGVITSPCRGHALEPVCVIATKPRKLNDKQLDPDSTAYFQRFERGMEAKRNGDWVGAAALLAQSCGPPSIYNGATAIICSL